MSFDELYIFDDDYDSGSTGTCAFTFLFDESIDRLCAVGSGVFVLTGSESIGDVALLIVLVLKVVESKSGRIIEIF